MIRMDQYGYIRTAYRVYQKSIKQICRETGHSRETVRKVLRSEPFVYSPRVEQPYPVMGPYLQVIDQWLAEDKDRPKKQRHTAKRIYDLSLIHISEPTRRTPISYAVFCLK